MTTPPVDPGDPNAQDPQAQDPQAQDPHTPGPSGQDPYGAPGYGAPPSGSYYGDSAYGAAPPPQNPYGAPPGGPGGEPYGVGAALSRGWNAFKGNPWPFVGIALLTVVLSAAVSTPFSLASSSGSSTGGLAYSMTFSPLRTFGQLLSSVVSLVGSAALIKGGLQQTRGEQATFNSMFTDMPWGQLVISAVLVGVASTIGFVLCILPGLVVLLLTMWTNYFIIDQRIDAIAAIRASFGLVRARLGDSLLTGIVAFLVGIVGVCACVVGLLVTIPLATLMLSFAYKMIQGQPVVQRA